MRIVTEPEGIYYLYRHTKCENAEIVSLREVSKPREHTLLSILIFCTLTRDQSLLFICNFQ